MDTLLIGMFLFLFAMVLVAVGIGLKVLEEQKRKSVKNVLSPSQLQEFESFESQILLEEKTEDGFDRLLKRLNIGERLDSLLQQSGLDWQASKLITMMLVMGFAGGVIGALSGLLILRSLSALVFAIVFALLPLLYVWRARSRRMAMFEEQFPEALDFLARSMRAGHAFSISLEMMGNESPDPIGQEFRVLFNEQNLGAPLEVAMQNLIKRVPTVDVRFFVSSVLLQRQTGGNLSEILLRLSHIIRERFRLKGQVKAASAHGRITALILTVLPIITFLLLLVVAPGYIPSMIEDKDGKWILVFAVGAQFVGYYWMRQIINIKV